METLPIADIVINPTFRYRLHTASPQLQRSIEQIGILVPLLVARSTEGWVLVDGHVRLEVARNIPLETVPVKAAPDIPRGLIQSVWQNHAQHPLSVVEKARVLVLLESMVTEDELQELYQFLEVPTRRMQLRLREIAGYPLTVQQYFHEQQFSLKQIERLRSLTVEKLLPWIELASLLRIKAPEFQQIIEMVWDIAVRENCSIEACYQQLGIARILKGNWTIQQKVQRLKQHLMTQRFPLLTRLRKLLEERSQQLQQLSSLPMRVQWDRNLEELGVWIQFFVEDVQDIKKLEELAKNPEFVSAVNLLLQTFTQTKE